MTAAITTGDRLEVVTYKDGTARIFRAADGKALINDDGSLDPAVAEEIAGLWNLRASFKGARKALGANA